MAARRLVTTAVTTGAGLLLAALGLVVLPAGPAAAVDTPVITLIDATNQPLAGSPFAGEEFAAQSQQTYEVGNPQSTQWTCSVDFGDGTAPSGYWRARFPPDAPCTEFHTYAAPGSYTITMTVTDPTGTSAQSTRAVSVTSRDVTPVDGGTEGAVVHLSGAPGATSEQWTTPDADHCVIATPDQVDTDVQCDDEGTYAFLYQGGSEATSGEYDVTFVNGPPAPTMQPVRYRTSGDVVSPRVGTGDDVRFVVDGHDPSWALVEAHPDAVLLGDDLTCHFDFGDGTTGVDSDRTFDGCIGFHVYTRPGTYTTTVTVTDGDGAAATTESSVEVVPRRIQVSSSGRQADGLRGSVSGLLTRPDGLVGRMRFVTPEGRTVVVPKVDRVSVEFGQVELVGRARVDGRSGYFVFADILKRGKIAMRLQVDQGDENDPDGNWTIIEDAEALRGPFTNVYWVHTIR